MALGDRHIHHTYRSLCGYFLACPRVRDTENEEPLRSSFIVSELCVCVCVCVFMYIFIYIYTHTHTYEYIHMNIYMYIYMYT